MSVTQPGTRPSSGTGLARNDLPESRWHWLDARDAEDERENEVQARVAAAREKARKKGKR